MNLGNFLVRVFLGSLNVRVRLQTLQGLGRFQDIETEHEMPYRREVHTCVIVKRAILHRSISVALPEVTRTNAEQ